MELPAPKRHGVLPGVQFEMLVDTLVCAGVIVKVTPAELLVLKLLSPL
jgi:hypothetical protein